VRNLTWGHVNDDGSIRTVGKGGALREVYPGDTLAQLLTRWRRYYVSQLGPARHTAPVLCGWLNRHTLVPGLRTRSSLCKIVTDRATKAGLGHLSPHDLRRSLARVMYDATDETGHKVYQITDIAHALGHSARSLSVTQEAYVGPLDDRGRRETR
jgi:integrase